MHALDSSPVTRPYAGATVPSSILPAPLPSTITRIVMEFAVSFFFGIVLSLYRFVYVFDCGPVLLCFDVCSAV